MGGVFLPIIAALLAAMFPWGQDHQKPKSKKHQMRHDSDWEVRAKKVPDCYKTSGTSLE